MFLLHFLNCFGIAVGPYVLVSRSFGLWEPSAAWRCLQVIGAYLLCQLVKMGVLATFVPPFLDNAESGILIIIREFISSSFGLADLFAIYYLITRVSTRGYPKQILIGLSWAAADVLLTKLSLIWIGVRSSEFDWKHIILSVETNLTLLSSLSAASLMWLYGRYRQGMTTDLFSSYGALVSLTLLLIYRDFLFTLADLALDLGDCAELLVKAGLSALVALGTFSLHVFLTQPPPLPAYPAASAAPVS